MKRGMLLFIFFLSISTALAAPIINFQNEDIQKGETILGSITTSGEFTKEILREDITFLEGRKQVPFEFDIMFYENTHYISIYANRKGNFTLQIPNVLYKEGTLSSINLEKNFTISEENLTQVLQIKPGLIKLGQEPKINLINLGSSNLTLEANKEEINIEPNEFLQKTLNSNSTLTFLEISTYKEFRVPILSLIVNGSSNVSINESKKVLDLKPNKEFLTVNIISGTEEVETIELFNFGEENITNLKISSTLGSLDLKSEDFIEAKDTINLTLTFKTKTEGYLKENLTINYDQYGEEEQIVIPLSIYIISEGSSLKDFNEVEKTCQELGGNVCQIDQSCNGTAKFTKGGDYCCLGTCQEVKKEENSSNSYAWITGLLIFAALAMIGFAIWQKAKKTKPKNSKEKLGEFSKKYSRRIKGSLER